MGSGQGDLALELLQAGEWPDTVTVALAEPAWSWSSWQGSGRAKGMGTPATPASPGEDGVRVLGTSGAPWQQVWP